MKGGTWPSLGVRRRKVTLVAYLAELEISPIEND